MRKLLAVAAAILASCFVASAQQTTPDAGPSWSRLQGLPAGVALHVTTTQQTSNCTFKAATEEALTCSSGSGAAESYPRTGIKSVKIRHRGRSTLAGLAIGAGGGAIIGAPLGQSGSFVGHGAAAVIIAVPGAIIGAIVGAGTDFTHSTVYKAP
jgi:uncharacterized protein YcfJ